MEEMMEGHAAAQSAAQPTAGAQAAKKAALLIAEG